MSNHAGTVYLLFTDYGVDEESLEGVFTSPEAARRALRELRAAGLAGPWWEIKACALDTLREPLREATIERGGREDQDARIRSD